MNIPIVYEPNIPVKIQLLRIDQYPIHRHDDIQLIYVIEGELELKLSYTRYALSPDSLHFIHNEDLHELKKISGDTLILSMYINMEYFKQFYPDLEDTIFCTNLNADASTYNKKKAIKDLMYTIIKETEETILGYEHRIKDNTLQILDILYKEFRSFLISRETGFFEHKKSGDLFQIERISRIVGYMYENYSRKITLSEIAANENMNVYYLSHLFHKFVGYNFRDFLSLIRIEMSEALLLATDMSISRIAEEVGFSHAKYYVHHFFQWFGHHPAQYRKLFSGETILHRSPRYEELPPSALLRKHFASYIPGAPDAKGKHTSITLDFQEESSRAYPHSPQTILAGLTLPGGTLSQRSLADAANALQSALAFQIPAYYYSENPQQVCIFLLESMVRGKREGRMNILFRDTAMSGKGLYAVNGMRKPLFYLLEFFSSLPEDYLEMDESHILSRRGEDFYLLLFNHSRVHTENIEILFANMKTNYKATCHFLSTENHCIEYWKQLNFQKSLSGEEINLIDNMTLPRVSFEILTDNIGSTMRKALDPLDILFVHFSPMG
jgi:AraC-like DNA-binding protein